MELEWKYSGIVRVEWNYGGNRMEIEWKYSGSMNCDGIKVEIEWN